VDQGSKGGLMALGLMCQYLQEKKKKDGSTELFNLIDEKSLQLGAYKAGKYSDERILQTYRHNVQTHLDIIPVLVKDNIKSFRISSSLFPLYEFAGSIARNDGWITSKLGELGQLFKQHGIRVTTHPGQFCVISSDKQSVIDNSIKELEYHAWMFDVMGFDQTPHYAINIHGGKADRSEKLIDVIKTLPDNVRNRLTLENDEKCYNVRSLLDINKHTGVPVVLDSHHFTFGLDDLKFIDAFTETMATWGSTKPLQHISNTEIGMENAAYNKKRAHSEMIRYVPPLQLEAIRANLVDVDVEAKLKNIALLKMREDFQIAN
jgi:UV DNA damage endonuclease